MPSWEPYVIDVPDAQVTAVLDRVRAYPWAAAPPGDSWQGGMSPAFLRRVTERWTSGYDWRRAQQRLNEIGSFAADIDGHRIHFLRVTGPGDALPVLLVPGWPSTVFDYAEVIEPLAAAGHDVVVASMPGYGWSSPPSQPTGPRGFADLLDRLMVDVLGLTGYIAGGSDFATYVAPWLALDHSDHVRGIWVTALNARPHGAPAGATSWPDTFTDQELAFLRTESETQQRLLPYAFVQALQGSTLSLAMVDNPVGQAAWILEKHHAWTPLPDGADPDEVFDLDHLLDTVMTYLLTDSFASSILIYPGLFGDPATLPEGQRVEVPTGFSAFTDPLVPTPPRSFADRAYRIVRWTTPPGGGHFAALAAPQTVTGEITAFTADLRAGHYDQ